MKTILSAFVLLLSVSVSAANHCGAYQTKGQERYIRAIEKVASLYDTTAQNLCSSSRFLAIEAQPTRKMDRDGNIIPHVSVQLHGEFDTCKYVIRDADLFLAEQKCYSGF